MEDRKENTLLDKTLVFPVLAFEKGSGGSEGRERSELSI